MRSVSKPLLPWFRFSRSLNWTLEEPTIWPMPPASPTFHPPCTLTVSSGETAHQIRYFGALTLPGVPLLTGHSKLLGGAHDHMAHGCYRAPLPTTQPACLLQGWDVVSSLPSLATPVQYVPGHRVIPSLLLLPLPDHRGSQTKEIKAREAQSAEKQFKWHLSPRSASIPDFARAWPSASFLTEAAQVSNSATCTRKPAMGCGFCAACPTLQGPHPDFSGYRLIS